MQTNKSPFLKFSVLFAALALILASTLFAGIAGARETTPGDPRPIYLPIITGPAAPPVVFTHGVASGDVTASQALLWTRGDREARLTLEIAPNPAFSPLTTTASTPLLAANDFIARLDIGGLDPASRYFYRWRGSGSSSRVGEFVTPPLPAQATGLRFAFSGDSDGTLQAGVPAYGPFLALDAARQDEIDFFIYLGDTIYSDSSLRPTGPAQTLAEYRDAYKTNRQIAALRDLMAATSVYAIWDDHEVYNDYAGQTVIPARYANGRQAFLEYMPVRTSDLPVDPTCAGRPLFRVFHWGSEADVFILDERSCRSASVTAQCTRPGESLADLAPTLPTTTRLLLGLPASPPSGCREAINDPSRTMLGPVQKAAFKQALFASTARHKFVVNELAIQQLYLLPYDRWEGYGAERRELLEFIRDQKIANVVFLSADLHGNFYNEVFLDLFSAPAPIAFEIVAGPIGTGTMEASVRRRGGQAAVDQLHLLFDVLGVDCRALDAFGYALVEVDAGAGGATVALKGEDGRVMVDQRNAANACTKVLGP